MGRKVTGSGTEVTIYGKCTQVTSYGNTCADSSRSLIRRAELWHFCNR